VTAPRIVVLAHGEPPPAALLKRAVRGASAFLCTDGAYGFARSLGLKPGWVVGDLDSLDPSEPLLPGVRVLLDPDPGASDLEKTLRLVAKGRFLGRLGGLEVWVLGAMGGRLDHTLANLQVAERFSGTLRLALADGSGTARLVRGRASFRARRGETVSLFPVGKAALRTRGLRYPLRGEPLEPGSRGLSNRASGRRFSVEVRGTAWLVRSAPPWA